MWSALECRRRRGHRLVRRDQRLSLRWRTGVRGVEREAKGGPLHAARMGGGANGGLRQGAREGRQHRVHCGALPPARQHPRALRRARTSAARWEGLASSTRCGNAVFIQLPKCQLTLISRWNYLQCNTLTSQFSLIKVSLPYLLFEHKSWLNSCTFNQSVYALCRTVYSNFYCYFSMEL